MKKLVGGLLRHKKYGKPELRKLPYEKTKRLLQECSAQGDQEAAELLKLLRDAEEPQPPFSSQSPEDHDLQSPGDNDPSVQCSARHQS